MLLRADLLLSPAHARVLIAPAFSLSRSNKWTLNSTTLPLTFLWAQLIIAVVLIQGCAAVGLLKLPPLNIQLAVDLAAVITVNVVGLVFNTLCLKLVDASYFQVGSQSFASLGELG